MAVGFDHLFTLEWEAADARQLLDIPRYYPVDNPDLATIVSNLTFVSADAPTIRAVCVDLSGLASARGRDEQDAVLGRMIEDCAPPGGEYRDHQCASSCARWQDTDRELGADIGIAGRSRHPFASGAPT